MSVSSVASLELANVKRLFYFESGNTWSRLRFSSSEGQECRPLKIIGVVLAPWVVE